MNSHFKGPLFFFLSKAGFVCCRSPAGQATGGEILVGPTTAERIKGHFVLESLGERTLKNVAGPVRLYRVIPPGVYEKVVKRE